jgi:hypothetical protein
MARIAAALGRWYRPLQKCSANQENAGVLSTTRRRNGPSGVRCPPSGMFPRRSCVIGRDPGLARRACYARQVPGDKCGMVRMAFPASLMSTCVCAVGEVQVGGTKERRLSIICGESCAGTTTGLGRKVFFCLTGPYLTRRATIGRLADGTPPWQRADRWTPLRAAPTSITAYTVRGSSV